jgi:cell division septation protein DedD
MPSKPKKQANFWFNWWIALSIGLMIFFISIFLGKWVGEEVMNAPPYISHTPKAMIHIPHIPISPIQPVIPSPSLQEKETIASPPLVIPPPAPNNNAVNSIPSPQKALGTQAAVTAAAAPISPVAPAAAAPAAAKPTTHSTPSKLNIPQAAYYKIQIGMFLDEGNAQVFQQKLQEQGYNALITEISQNGERFYQVWIGPFPTRSMAEIMAKQLKASGYRAFVIKNVQ